MLEVSKIFYWPSVSCSVRNSCTHQGGETKIKLWGVALLGCALNCKTRVGGMRWEVFPGGGRGSGVLPKDCAQLASVILPVMLWPVLVYFAY